MPYKKEYDFSWGTNYEVGQKPEVWEAANAAIINKWMDQDLPILVDIATCLSDYIQASLHDKPNASTHPLVPSSTTDTPAVDQRLANEMRWMDNPGPGARAGEINTAGLSASQTLPAD